MTFVLGAKSMTNLHGVHPKLVAVVERAIAISGQDFTVQEGLRSSARQRALVASGASKTLNSKHLEQPDGYGHAVDLVPWIDGTPRWEWGPTYVVAAAVREAAIGLAVPIRWGGVWDRRLNDLPAAPAALREAVTAYSARHPGPDFLDGVHWELAR
jgi:peptidoglycan L-alanyl-D-glutamate endopeptidase CwlK